MAVGDGITAPSRKPYGFAETEAEAEATKDRLLAGKYMQGPRMPGNGKLYPAFEVEKFNPLDFVGRQNRDEYTGKRLANLCGDLYAKAKDNAAEIL